MNLSHGISTTTTTGKVDVKSTYDDEIDSDEGIDGKVNLHKPSCNTWKYISTFPECSRCLESSQSNPIEGKTTKTSKSQNGFGCGFHQFTVHLHSINSDKPYQQI